MNLETASSIGDSSSDDLVTKVGLALRGNLIVPLWNPFLKDPVDTTAKEFQRNDVQWLGKGLQLLMDHVLTVSTEGIILSITPKAEYDFVALKQENPSATVIHLDPHEFLCPGLIDLHIHAPQYSFTGTATDRPLTGPDGWLETYTFPAEARLGQEPHTCKTVYGKLVKQTLAQGTTTAVYFATLDLKPCQTLVEICQKHGQRALIGKVCMDRNAPPNYCQSTQQNIDETRALIDFIYQKAGRRSKSSHKSPLPLILPLITPRFIPTCTPSLLSQLGDLAQEHNCHITSHISESIDEVAWSKHLDETEDNGGGRSDAVIFQQHGLLTDQCIMAHGVHLSETDAALMKEQGSAVAHCPLSNFFFAGGSLPCRRLLMERGNKVGLGTDVAGGYDSSILHSARTAVLTSLGLEHASGMSGIHKIDYRHAFYLATLGGAQALGLEDRIGTLKVGMEFDAIVLSPSSNVDVFDTDTPADVFQKLVNLGNHQNIKKVFVQGREVK